MISVSEAFAAPTVDPCTASNLASVSRSIHRGDRLMSTRSFMLRRSRPAFLSAPGCVAQCLKDVLALEIGVIRQNIVDRARGTDLPDDHADGDTHAANAGLTAHDARLLRAAIELVHAASLCEDSLTLP